MSDKPNEPTLDQEEAELRGAAQQADASGTSVSDVLTARAQPGNRAPESGKQGEGQPPAGGEAPAKPSEPTDEGTDDPNTPEETSEEPAPDKGAGDDKGKPGEPEASRERKEEERRNKSWQKLDEERKAQREAQAKFEAERAQYAAERAAWEAQKAAPTPAAPDGGNIAAEVKTFEDLAKHYEESGDLPMAKLARQKAQALLAQMPQQPTVPHPQAVAAAQAQFKAAWVQNEQQAIKEFPELADPSSPRGVKVRELINGTPLLQRTPEGALWAARLVDLKEKADQSDAYKAEIQRLTDENKNLRSSLQLPGTPAGDRPGETKFEDLSLDEQEKQLRAAAAAQDARR